MDAELAAAAELAADGYLYRALAAVEAIHESCPTDDTQRALAGALGDVGLDARAIEAYRAYLLRAGDGAAGEVAERIAELEARPEPGTTPSPDDQALALTLYRRGVNHRLGGDLAAAVADLRRSYALWPHPLTIVQIGMAHAESGDDVEARKAYARSLAIAEELAGARARPMPQRGHTDRVRGVVLLADGKTMLSVGLGQGVFTWDRRSGRAIDVRTTGDPEFQSLAASADGRLIATAGKRGLQLYDRDAGEHVELGGEVFASVAMSADGAHVCAARVTGEVHVWDASGHELRTWSHDKGIVMVVAVTSDGELIATAGTESVELRRVSSGALVHEWPVDDLDPVMGVAISPKADLVATAGVQGVTLYDASTGAVLRAPGEEGAAGSVAFSPDGSWLVSGPLGSGPAVVLATDGGAVLHRLQPDADFANAFVAVGPDGVIATGDLRGQIRLWSSDTGEELALMRGYGAGAMGVAVSRDSGRVIAIDETGAVMLWRAGERTAVDVLGAHAYPGQNVAIAADGARAVSMSEIGGLGWDLSVSPATATELEAIYGARGGIELSADGTRVYTTGRSGFTVWDTATWQPVASADTAGYLSDLALVAAGAVVAVAPPAAYDAATGEKLRDLEVDSFAHVVEPLPDNRVLFADGASLYVAGLDGAAAGAGMFDDAWAFTWAMAASSDGRTAVTGNLRGQLATWDLTAGAMTHVWGAHEGYVQALDIAGGVVISASDDASIKMWSLAGEHLATMLSEPGGAWVIALADGRVEGGDGRAVRADELVYWAVGDVYLPGFVGWQRYAAEGLLRDVLDSAPPL